MGSESPERWKRRNAEDFVRMKTAQNFFSRKEAQRRK
jgi:hypothetical protein